MMVRVLIRRLPLLVLALWLTPTLLAVSMTSIASAETAFFPRYPAISPDGSQVVFGCQGDLWRVPIEGGRAERLTAHPAYHRNPVFSPDGRQIAFAADREGSFDVYVMPAGGGRPERLTYAPSNDLPHDFSPDGQQVYFSSARPWQYPVRPQIHQVPERRHAAAPLRPLRRSGGRPSGRQAASC
jgi:dipeptidyl aminopeptidase/acylaminoacyl peptidase